MLLPWKLDVLLLLVFAVVSIDAEVFGKKPCSKEQKNHILETCTPFVLKGNPVAMLPAKNAPCCIAVRELQKSINWQVMQCVVDRLTGQEKKEYDAPTIIHLGGWCAQPPSRVLAPAPLEEIMA
ncbi:hypothetical protein ACP70R_004071 [Stipagrostis hirtigluma subsp. patula]